MTVITVPGRRAAAHPGSTNTIDASTTGQCYMDAGSRALPE